ncbi:MAG: hypothetical protein EAX86_11875 [Candidatus Heimdallarchaeota archaeon]|nr:hypothetical protein [Candidatus Heimdallarchaeota archaeon]
MDNLVSEAFYIGVSATLASNLSFINNTISGCGNCCFNLLVCHYNLITNNSFLFNDILGLYLSLSANNTIRNNKFLQSGFMILGSDLSFIRQLEVCHNYFNGQLIIFWLE